MMLVRGYVTALPSVLTQGCPSFGVRLDLNEVADGQPAGVLAAVRAAADSVNRYPDPVATALVERLASRLCVGVQKVAVGCGSTSLCAQLIQATCDQGDEVVFGWPSFEAYPLLARVARARPRSVPLTAGHALDLEAIVAAITPSTRLIFVCNPNNPTGTASRRDELTAFLNAVPRTVLVVLDEAYREFVTDPDVPDGLEFTAARTNVAVLRTFSKAYGLAGLRVGYAVAAPDVIAALRAVGVPFSVNSVAQAAAIAALDTTDGMRARCAEIAAGRDRLRAELVAAGFEVPASQANFLWLPLGPHTTAFVEHCRRHNIVIRAIARFGARVTIGTPEQNKDFLSAARSFSMPSASAAVVDAGVSNKLTLAGTGQHFTNSGDGDG